jgi:hypothetical protein
MQKIFYDLEVYSDQIDSMGHVNNPISIHWMEIGRTKLLEAVGMPTATGEVLDTWFWKRSHRRGTERTDYLGVERTDGYGCCLRSDPRKLDPRLSKLGDDFLGSLSSTEAKGNTTTNHHEANDATKKDIDQDP